LINRISQFLVVVRSRIQLQISPINENGCRKFAMIDSNTAITGSFNWVPPAAQTNDEILLVIHSEQLAAHFNRVMNRPLAKALGFTERLRH